MERPGEAALILEEGKKRHEEKWQSKNAEEAQENEKENHLCKGD